MSANLMFPTCWFIVSGLMFVSGEIPVGLAIAGLASFWLRFELALAHGVQNRAKSGDNQ